MTFIHRCKTPRRDTSVRGLQRNLIGSLALAALLCAIQAVATTKKPPLHPININTATSEELQQVPGIGPATASKILQMRKSYGSFKSVDDLLAIKGIGKKRLDKMRKYLTVGKSAISRNDAPSAVCPGCSKSPAPSVKPMPTGSKSTSPTPISAPPH